MVIVSSFFFPFSFQFPSRGEVEVPYERSSMGQDHRALEPTRGPRAHTTAMNDLQQGGRVATDAGISDAYICIETDGDRWRCFLAMADEPVCTSVSTPAECSSIRAS